MTSQRLEAVVLDGSPAPGNCSESYALLECSAKTRSTPVRTTI